MEGKAITVLMAYADRLERFTRWWVQLWAESLGKDGKGSTAGRRRIGPVDQHSQQQLYLAGPNDKLFTVLTVAAPQGRGLRMDAGSRGAPASRALPGQPHRRPRRRARPRHRRYAGEERPPDPAPCTSSALDEAHERRAR